MSVPPRSFTPAASACRVPSGPSFTHEAWTLVISGWSARRATACTRIVSRKVGSATGAALEVDRRLHRHEGQRHELGEPARAALLLAGTKEVPRPAARRVDVAEHQRHVRAQPDPVRRLVHGEPLLRRDLVGADDAAHLVVEHLRRSSRQRTQAEVGEVREVLLERETERRRALPHLERRERVHVDPGHRVTDRAHHARVVVTRERRVDPALQADLGRAALPRLLGSTHDLLERHEIRRPAQVRRELPLRERAEAAAEVADVRVLDVPRDDVGDLVAADLAAKRVGGGADASSLLPARLEEPRDLVLAELGSGQRERRRVATRRRTGTPPGSPGAQASSRARPVASAARSTCGTTAGSSQRSRSATYSG